MLITLNDTHTHTHTRARKDSSGRGLGPPRRPLSNTQHCQKTDIHAPGGIRTRNPSKQAATYPCLKIRGHWNLLIKVKDL